MTSVFSIKRNDTSPAISRTLLDSAGDAINLTGATVRFHLKDKAGVVKVDAAAVIVGDPLLGVVQYDWIAADTDTAGNFKAEFEVTYADSTIETFPNNEHIEVVITEDLA